MKIAGVLAVSSIFLLGSGCCDHKKQMREINSELQSTEIEISLLKLKINQKEIEELTERFNKLP